MVIKIIMFVLLNISIFANDTFTIKLSKTKAYQNEPILVILTLKSPKNNQFLKVDFDEFLADNFYIKELESKDEIIKEYNIKKYYYILFAKDFGTVSIPSQEIRVARREAKTNFTVWKTLKTNKKVLDIYPLPNGIDIVGDLTFDSFIDNNSENNKTTNLTLRLKGLANIDDIKPFDLNLSNQIYFTTKPIIKYSIKDDKLYTTFVQKFSILSNQSFTIDSFSFRYFNSSIELIESLKTESIDINIPIGSDKIEKYIYGLVGFILGMLFYFLYIKIIKKRLFIFSNILINDDKKLYNKLLPYNKNKNYLIILKLLDKKLYK